MLARILTVGLCLLSSALLSSCVSGRHVLHLGEKISEPVETASSPASAHLICWNVHKAEDQRFAAEVREILDMIPGTDEVILCLQEVRNCTYDLIRGLHREDVRGHYAPSWRLPFSENSTGVLTVGNWDLPAADVERMSSPRREAYVTSPKVALRTALALPGGGALQVINCHALNFVPRSQFGRQIDELFASLDDPGHSAIVCGDFNTWSASRLSILREKADAAGFTEADAGRPSRSPAARWVRRLSRFNGYDPEIPLDRIFTRGIEVHECYYLQHSRSSDHLPLVLRFTVDPSGD